MFIKSFFLATLLVVCAHASSAPWYTYQNILATTLGADPTIVVSQLQIEPTLQVNVTVSSKEYNSKLNAIAALVNPSVTFGNLVVTVSVQYMDGSIVIPTLPSSSDDVVTLLNEILKNNPYFIDIQTKDNFGTTMIYPMFTRSVISFFNDDLTEFSASYHGIVSQMFREVFVPSIGDNAILASTTIAGQTNKF